jgi:hypothetical protein
VLAVARRFPEAELEDRDYEVVASDEKELKILRDKKDAKTPTPDDKLAFLRKLGLMAPAKSLKNLRIKTKMYVGGTLGVNASAGKYLLNWGSNNFFGVNNIQNAQEWNSFDSIFDEFFVVAMAIKYQPNNRYSANAEQSTSTAGAPGYVNTCGVALCALQHDQLAYSDTSSAYVRVMPAANSLWTNVGDPWTFTWRNVEKFAWDSVEISGVSNTQSWMNVSSVNTYGGFVQAATPNVSGLTGGLSTLLVGGVFGFFMAEFEVAFRCRS